MASPSPCRVPPNFRADRFCNARQFGIHRVGAVPLSMLPKVYCDKDSSFSPFKKGYCNKDSSSSVIWLGRKL
ncbi:unnamed protein product [Urochloa humidicola]